MIQMGSALQVPSLSRDYAKPPGHLLDPFAQGFVASEVVYCREYTPALTSRLAKFCGAAVSRSFA